jgi:hypothetical protein
MKAATFTITENTGFCNALRRTLLSDIQTWAPKELLVRVNMSCQTDEFIAHRIGMIPFEKVGEGDKISLSAMGPRKVLTKDFEGIAFRPIYDNIEVIVLDKDQRIDLTVIFDKQCASKHARYSPCAAVGMTRTNEGHHKLSFESIDSQTPTELLLCALDHLDERIDKALHAMAQPSPVPKSMC